MTAVPLQSLGSPVSADRLWTDALVPNRDGGWNWIGPFYNFPQANSVEWIVAHLGGARDGTYDRYVETLPAPGGKGRYPNQNYTIAHQLRAPNGDIFFGALSTFAWKYTAADEQLHELAQLPVLAGESGHDDAYYASVFNTDGTKLWATTIATAGSPDKRPQLVSFDPSTWVATQWGRVGSNDHTLPGFGYYAHADGVGTDWIYVLVGEDIWDLVAMQISTGDKFVLAQGLVNSPFMDFQEQPEGLVVNIYTQKNQPGQTLTQYWVVDGVLYAFSPSYDPATLPFTARSVTPYSNPIFNPPEIDESVNPYAINWKPNGLGPSTPWTRIDFALDFLGPVNIESLTPEPGGGVLGVAVEYQGWFEAAGGAGAFLGSGPDVANSVGLNEGSLVYITGYPNAILYAYDRSKPWDFADGTNPVWLGAFSNGNSFSGVKTAARLAYGSQKNRLYMVGTRDRSGFGAGIGYYNITAKTFGGTFANLTLYTSHLGLAVFDKPGEANRIVLAGTTSDGSTAQLVMFDLDLNEIERQTPISGLTDTGRLYRTSEPTVVVGFSRAGQKIYRWDIVAKTLLGQLDLSSFGAEVISCQGQSGAINAVVGSHLLRIDPVTLSVLDLGTLMNTDVFALAENEGNIYLGIDTTLYWTPVPGGTQQGANVVDRILQNEATAALRTVRIKIQDPTKTTGVSGVLLTGSTPATLKIAKGGGNWVASAGATLRELTGQTDSTNVEYDLTYATGDVDTLGDLSYEISGGTPAIATASAGVPVIPAQRTADISAAVITAIQAGLATASAMASIPTNPLLTTDSRLGNLDAAVSSRASGGAVAALPSSSAIATAVLASSLGSGHTVQGVLRRMDWINIGRMTGGLSVLATFYQYDGTIGIQATQDPVGGTRVAASVVAGD